MTLNDFSDGNAHVQLAAIEYLNISGLVIDFATSPVWTSNSFFGLVLHRLCNGRRAGCCFALVIW